ncbi:type I restriction endonuclease subunit R [Acinetobacter baumannii]|uniref:type I restriction endonuclease subunit R n=1 Tax=Acinetobacter baumannii TaxID=470 RepID=UPI00244ADE5D|nr:type I restriction endonuclease subunit R [Acinetobacter baumannii]MDH2543995.1 type I restriction endonuclease subunit R [Acinetobacter baumannii]
MSSSENNLENALIAKLEELKYKKNNIHDIDSLNANFRNKFNELNQVQLTDAEFERLLQENISSDVFTCSQRLREQHVFDREDGTPLYYTLVNTKDWCKNEFEVIRQFRVNSQNSYHRYDVIILINGLPLVQIELKTLDISPRRAMQQIVDYKNDVGNGYTNTLFVFMQLFIVSNQKQTYYFSNNQEQHFNFNADEQFLPIYQWADPDNRKINDLHEFSEKFLNKCKLGKMISRYMVLVATEQKILIMRPYQIYAVEAIIETIQQNRGNGYIWHTTGSGKTLTSFKASTLLKDNPDIEKCLFVVDRKDLDRQTREEFNKFQEGCVEENTNTASLVRRLLSTNYSNKVIVTTIQKLALALNDQSDNLNKAKSLRSKSPSFKEQLKPLQDKRIAIIFDECHRSQFGENHQAIKKFFPNSQLFGFTGTPIFGENSTVQRIDGREASYAETKDIFQQQLHAYTITHAIEDQNVLKFNIEYFRATQVDENKPITARVGDPITQAKIVEAILNKHYHATHERKFNAIFATSSINDAISYYHLFKAKQAELLETNPDYQVLNVACVFSPPAEGDADVKQLSEDLPNEQLDNLDKPNEKKQALTTIINDYNAQFGTSHSLSQFDNYYQDVQQRIKDQKYPNSQAFPQSQKIDITIVVDMLLTGFDSKYLSTLYVDKNLKYHGLIQAFSRTNRVLNDSKPYGTIIDFRGLESAVDESVKLFSNLEKDDHVKEIWLVESATQVIAKLAVAKQKLDTFMQSKGLPTAPEEVVNLQGDTAKAEFINKFKEIQRLQTQLSQYTDLTEEQVESINKIIPKDELRSFQSVYLETAKRLKPKQDNPDNFSDETVQQVDFEFVLFNSAMIDYDYIMKLISDYSHTSPEKQSMTREELVNLISSDAKFVDDAEDIKEYIFSLKIGEGLSVEDIKHGFEQFKLEKTDYEIEEIAEKYGLEVEPLRLFVEATLARMILDNDLLHELLSPLGLGWKERSKTRKALIQDLTEPMQKLTNGREISGWDAHVK